MKGIYHQPHKQRWGEGVARPTAEPRERVIILCTGSGGIRYLTNRIIYAQIHQPPTKILRKVTRC